MFHNCGFNSAGVMLGGGCGDQIAQWIINGRPSIHMYSCDVRYSLLYILKCQCYTKMSVYY